MQTYEVEVKSFLGSSERAEEVREALKAADPRVELLSRNRQLNHYFEPSTGLGSEGGLPAQAGTLDTLSVVIAPHLPKDAKTKFADLARKARSFSVRTRDKDGTVLLVVKASVGDDTSENGVARMEFEETVPLSLKVLDELVLSAGFTFQAKWSREREEYVCSGVNVTLDKNAGYGWLAEFEKVVDGPEKVDDARREVHTLMEELGVAELPQDRLERMFAFYNAHWPEYYGTDKIFTVE